MSFFWLCRPLPLLTPYALIGGLWDNAPPMTSLLAIDTSTDACSVALNDDGDIRQQLAVQPRQHNQLLFPMLEEILGPGKRPSLDGIAFSSGPGSFTGLRVGCSAVQGLAYTLNLRCLPVNTLACLAQGAIRRGLASEGQYVLSLIDARVGELYFALFRVDQGMAKEVLPPAVAKPELLEVELPAPTVIAVGDGLALAEHGAWGP